MAQKVKSITAEIGIDSRKFTSGANAVKQETSKITSGLSSMKSALTGITIGAAAAGKVFQTAFELGEEGAALVYTTEKFDNLAQSIGTTSAALMGGLKDATKGLISDANLVANATDLMSLGLVKTYDEAIRLTAAASQLGMNMNQLTLTLTNQTTMRFDSLGISVDGFQEKVDALKESGMSANDAFNEAFLQQAEQQIATVGDIADSGAASFMKLEATFKNLSDTAKMKLAPSLTTAAEALNTLLNWTDRVSEAKEQLNARLLKTTDSYEDYLIEILKTKDAAYGLNVAETKTLRLLEEEGLSIDEVKKKRHGLIDGVLSATDKMQALNAEEYDAIETNTKLTAAQEQLKEQMALVNGEYDVLIPATEESAEATEAAAAAMALAAEEAKAYRDYLGDIIDALYSSGDASSEFSSNLKAIEYNTAVNREELEQYKTVADGLWAGGAIDNAELYWTNQRLGIAAVQQELQAGLIDPLSAAEELQNDFNLSIEASQGYISGASDAMGELSEKFGIVMDSELGDMGAEDLAGKLGENVELLNYIKGLLDDLDGKSVNSSVTVTTNYRNNGIASGTGPSVWSENIPEPRANGTQGTEVVPPGYPNDSYIVGLSSGERYNVQTSNDAANSSETSQQVTFDYEKMGKSVAQAIMQMGAL